MMVWPTPAPCRVMCLVMVNWDEHVAVPAATMIVSQSSALLILDCTSLSAGVQCQTLGVGVFDAGKAAMSGSLAQIATSETDSAFATTVKMDRPSMVFLTDTASIVYAGHRIEYSDSIIRVASALC